MFFWLGSACCVVAPLWSSFFGRVQKKNGKKSRVGGVRRMLGFIRTHKPPPPTAGHVRARLCLLNSKVHHFRANGLTANPRSLTSNPVAWASTIMLAGNCKLGENQLLFFLNCKLFTCGTNHPAAE